jgi:lipoprotein-releasing system permease protein
MNTRLLLGIAKTHLLTKVKQTAIAALGVTFGIGSYITLVSFMTGLNEMLDSLILNQTPHIHVYNEIEPSEKQPIANYIDFEDAVNIVQSIKPKLSQTKIHNALPLIEKLNTNEKVRGAIPQLNAPLFYISGPIELVGNLKGIDIMKEVGLFNFGDYIIEGTPKDLENNSSGIFLGSGVAEKMSLKVGERIQVRTSQDGIFPLKIEGIFQSGIADLDNVQSYANLATVQRVLGVPNNYITDINVKLYDMEDAPALAKSIASQYKLKAVDIATANAQFETGTTIRNLITYAVSITLLIVAGFGIYNILNMLIYEKMNDIAILKATGFSGKDVQFIFLSQAMIIGIIGGVLGLAVGYFLSVLIDGVAFETEALPTISTYPVNFNIWFYVIGISFALVSTFFAGYLPSLKARKIDPVEIIRGQ